MSEEPKVIWAQETAVGWEESISTIYQVDHFHKYHHDDTVVALQAKVARYEAALMRLGTAECFGSGEILGRHLPDDPYGREIIARMKYARQALKETTDD